MDMKDPHYLPEYLNLYEKLTGEQFQEHFGGEGLLYSYGDDNNYIVYPFMKRPILDPELGGLSGLYDIVSPYGYGGPLARIKNTTLIEPLWKGFFHSFSNYCQESNIVSEFCRLHPVFANYEKVQRFSDGDTLTPSRIVYHDLTRSKKQILAGVTKKRWQYIQKALGNHDLIFNLGKTASGARYFYEIYTKTMRRVGANNKYFFPLSFFEAAFRDLDGHLDFAYATFKKELVAASLVLQYGDMTYFWFAASKAEHQSLRANDLIVYYIFLNKKKEGFKYFVMGGGNSPGDSLYKYKASFSDLYRDFYIYKKIHLKKEYKELVELRRRYSGQTDGSFFPEYRLP